MEIINKKGENMKIELINRNAKSLEDAYGLTTEKLEEFIINLNGIELENITNKREHIIPLIAAIVDFETAECAANIIGLLEDIEIENTVDLIETIYNVNEELGKKYILILFKLADYKSEIIDNILAD